MKLDILPHIRAAKMTQAAVAEAVGISPGFLSEIISGKKDPSMETLDKLAAVLNVPKSALFADATPTSGHQMDEGEAAPYVAAPRSALAEAVAAMSRGLTRPETYRSAVTDATLGLRSGDILIIDMTEQPTPGDTVVATICDDGTGAARTVLRQWVPGWLCAGTDAPVALSSAGQTVAILGVVAATLRAKT